MVHQYELHECGNLGKKMAVWMLLRDPNATEYYWYGRDEIYLTLGVLRLP